MRVLLVLAFLCAVWPHRAEACAEGDCRSLHPARTLCVTGRAPCFAADRYLSDLCSVIEDRALAEGLNPHFFARLLWQESRFQPRAVSPAGARGVAQFMPATARIRGLDDPFSPGPAVAASAAYLAELAKAYGNVGLAAAAYNAGEGRVDDFIRRDRRLPGETRRYVMTITGIPATGWKQNAEAPDFTLAAGRTFHQACTGLGTGMRLRAFDRPIGRPAFGVILASHFEAAEAEAIFQRLKARHPEALGAAEVVLVRTPKPALPDRRHTIQIGAASRGGAYTQCGRLQRAGVPCFVLKN